MPAASLSKARQAEEVKALQEGGRVGKQLQAVRGSAGSPTALRALGCSAGGPPEDLSARGPSGSARQKEGRHDIGFLPEGGIDGNGSVTVET